ncbi:MAG: outer membrane protein assembly factor BamD [Verrucomicrobiae bacterium]|nr:outer membrane protein assembly factor BamD [Verrucomicrobiae bacterium]
MVKKGLFLIAIGLIAFPYSSPAPIEWIAGEGWVQDETVAVQGKNSREQLQIGRQYENVQDWKQARQSYMALVRKWPFSFNAGEAQFKIGWCSEKIGEFAPAFKAYQRCIEKYPASNFFEMALERQYNIANLYLAGERQRILGVPFIPSMEKTVEMYQQIIKNAPFGRYAPDSQFKIGLGYEKQKKWAEAVKAYTKILDRYPGNDIVDDAQYQIGHTWFQAANAAQYDQGAAQKALDAFNEFLARYPNNEKAPQAQENIKLLENRATSGSLKIAEFYESQKRIDPAIIYYNDVIQKSPSSTEADAARKKIETLVPLTEVGPTLPKNFARANPSTLPDPDIDIPWKASQPIDSSTYPSDLDFDEEPLPPLPSDLEPELPEENKLKDKKNKKNKEDKNEEDLPLFDENTITNTIPTEPE